MEQLELFQKPEKGNPVAVRNEKELRKWWRERMGEVGITPRWIEPALGSTQGLPDCFQFVGDPVIWAELKYSKDAGPVFGFEVQKEQAREIPKLISDGGKVLFVIGTTHFVALSLVTSPVLSGVFDTGKHEETGWFRVPYSSSGEFILRYMRDLFRIEQ